MAWTYMLLCADDSTYVGSTIDLERRLGEHNAGIGAAYTRPRRRRPVQVIWAAEFTSIEDAYRYEKQIQNWGRDKRPALAEGRLEDLPWLARPKRKPPRDESQR